MDIGIVAQDTAVTVKKQPNFPEFWSEFADCARQALPAPQVQALMEALRRFDLFADIRDFTCLVATGATAARGLH